MGNQVLKGKMIGNPVMLSVDKTGCVDEKHKYAYIVEDFKLPLGYGAYIFDKSYTQEHINNFLTYSPSATILYDVEDVSQIGQYDVIEVYGNGVLHIAYSDKSDDNVLFITNKCNSNCVMCPDSNVARQKDLGERKHYLNELIELIPSDTSHLTITGGEPTLLKWDLLPILEKCKEKFVNTSFLMLSNGRSFCVKDYREAFLSTIPKYFQLAVPLYSDNAEEHDAITRATGSFVQTTRGLKYLQQKVDLEIRIVIMQSNYKKLENISEYIVHNLPHTKTVSFMGLELLGNAALERDDIWVDYIETAPYIEAALHTLFNAGIEGKIYNYPLCGLPERLWPVASKSITDYKVRFKPECEQCSVKNVCGGFFFSTINYKKVVAKPISEE